MTTLLPDIKSRDWQISTQGVGLIAEGLGDIRQCLDICLRTTKGSDPLRPEFGSDIFQFVDKPLNTAIPNIVRSIIEAVQIWEKRVVIQKVKYLIEDRSNVDFLVTYRLVDEELIDLLKLQLSEGFIVVDTVQIGTLTIYALFPPNANNKRYQIEFSINENTALPVPPAFGFETIDEMYNWMVANWSGYGTWQKASDRIIGFLKVGYTSASISISLIGVYKYSANIPILQGGRQWKVLFTPNGGTQLQSDLFTTMDQILFWINSNWPSYGLWTIEASINSDGEFDLSDFEDNDFYVNFSGYLLTLQSESVMSAVLYMATV